jgi:2-haloacid dehalogenase
MRYRAYLFDVQGTLLDFFNPVRTAVDGYLRTVGADPDRAAAITRLWRSDYFERCTRLTQSADHWNPVQDQYIDGFIDVCARSDIPVPDRDVATEVASSWQNLVPWADTRAGLATVRSGAVIAALSNTDMRTVVQMFKRLRIDWDAVLSAEIFGHFKPEPTVYRRALRYLGVEPPQAAMVASHPYDLRAAAALGLGTVFVYRPDEYGSTEFAHQDNGAEFDQRVTSIADIR